MLYVTLMLLLVLASLSASRVLRVMDHLTVEERYRIQRTSKPISYGWMLLMTFGVMWLFHVGVKLDSYPKLISGCVALFFWLFGLAWARRESKWLRSQGLPPAYKKVMSQNLVLLLIAFSVLSVVFYFQILHHHETKLAIEADLKVKNDAIKTKVQKANGALKADFPRAKTN